MTLSKRSDSLLSTIHHLWHPLTNFQWTSSAEPHATWWQNPSIQLLNEPMKLLLETVASSMPLCHGVFHFLIAAKSGQARSQPSSFGTRCTWTWKESSVTPCPMVKVYKTNMIWADGIFNLVQGQFWPPNSNQPTSKRYMYEYLWIPFIQYLHAFWRQSLHIPWGTSLRWCRHGDGLVFGQSAEVQVYVVIAFNGQDAYGSPRWC